MADLDLRPLSLGEILDRTFSLYRRNFVLFVGITALPNLLVLALNLVEALNTPLRARQVQIPSEQFQGATPGLLAFGIGGMLLALVVYVVSYLFAQGGTVFAVSELYLGRTATIGASLKRMWGHLLILFGVVVLNGLAILGAMIFLIIPGIYVMCRLTTCVPAALLEDLGPLESLRRSFFLTKGSAGRAFLILLLSLIVVYAAMMLFMFPFLLMIGLSAQNPEMVRVWMVLSQIASFVAGILVGPILTIATAVFYYDLRVRKEGFDLQLMLKAADGVAPSTPGAASLAS